MKPLLDLTKDALELPSPQRLTLARILLDLTEPDLDFSPEVETAWDAEISRRLAAVQAGTAHSKTLDEVFSTLDRRFPA